VFQKQLQLLQNFSIYGLH